MRFLKTAFMTMTSCLAVGASNAAHAAGGVSVVNGRVIIDGTEVDPAVEYHTSAKTGKTYRIWRNGNTVSVISQQSKNGNGGSAKSVAAPAKSSPSGQNALDDAEDVIIVTGLS